MPPRSAKKSAAKKPSLMAKKSTSPVVASPIHEGTTPSSEPHSIAEDIETSEVVATATSAFNNDFAAKGEGSPSLPMIWEEKAVKSGETKLVTIAEKITEEDVQEAGKELHSKEVDEVSAAKEPAVIGKEPDAEKVLVELEAQVQSQSECKEILEDQEAEVEVKQGSTLAEKMNADEGDFVQDVGGGGGGGDDVASDDDGGGGGGGGGDVDNQENGDNVHPIYMQDAIMEVKKRKETEIFVGGLDKGAVEDDLIKIFEVFGDIESVRIVRNSVTQKSKGFAFIRFASPEHAVNALDVLKFGTEVNGKHVRVLASQDKTTLYLGNICKSWIREQVFEKLKSLGVELLENLILHEDPANEGKNKGFAFLEFCTHSDAKDAIERLRKPDAVFGLDRTAKVAFVRTPLNPSEEMMLQVKTVYLEGIPLSWDEQKVRECCQVYGEIERIVLSQNFSSRKRKDFGFVEFSSRESALACVEGINNLQLGDGDAKVRADIAKPMNKRRLSEQGVRGSFNDKKDGEAVKEVSLSKKKRKSKSVGSEIKIEKKPNLKVTQKSEPSASQNKEFESKIAPLSTASIKSKKRGRKVIDTSSFNQHPSKNMRRNQNYGKSLGTAAPEHHLHPSDLAPHAGYLPASKKFNHPYKYDRRRSYNNDLSSGSNYARAIHGTQTSYQSYTRYANYQAAGYQYPYSRGYALGEPY